MRNKILIWIIGILVLSSLGYALSPVPVSCSQIDTSTQNCSTAYDRNLVEYYQAQNAGVSNRNNLTLYFNNTYSFDNFTLYTQADYAKCGSSVEAIQYDLMVSTDNITYTTCYTNNSACRGSLGAYNTTMSVSCTGNSLKFYFREVGSSYVRINEFYFTGNVYSPGGTISSLSLSRYNQTPINLTAFNIIGSNLTIIYNISSNNYSAIYPNITTAKLYSKVNNSLTDKLIFVNGSSYGGYLTNNLINNISNLFIFVLDDNNIYPAVYNTNFSSQEFNTHYITTINNGNNYFSVELLNVSNSSRYNFFEFMGNTSSSIPLNLYYCNSSYSTGSITSSNCVSIGTLAATSSFNHSHSAVSKHQVIPFSIVNGKVGGLVTVTPTSFFIGNPTGNGAWDIYTSADLSRPTNFKTSANNGNSYTVLGANQTVDAHLHQYNGDEVFFDYSCVRANNSLIDNCSTVNNQYIQLPYLPPTPVTILSPNNSNYNNYLLINYTNATTPQIQTSISYYNISLLNSDTTFNSTIYYNNSLNNSYLWLVNVTPKTYYVSVCAIDNLTFSACTISQQFNISIGINITAQSYKTNASVTNFTINLTSLTTNLTYYINTTTGQALFNVDGVNGTYSAYITSVGYASYYQNITVNNNLLQNFTLLLYPTNSITFNIYDETTGNLILQNSSVLFYNSVYGSTTYTIYGSGLVENITAASYLVTISSSGYTSRSYTLTVGNGTWQNLNVYLTNATTTTILSIKDEDNLASIDSALITMYKQVNTSWVAIESKTSDITGRAQFTYNTNTNYKFYISKSGYVDYVFYLTPILFSSYDIFMKKANNINISQDYDDISLIYSPSIFENNNITLFNFIIQSPNGRLINYGYNLTYSGGSVANSGTNAIGGQLTNNVNITGAIVTDVVEFNYYYQTTTSNGTRYFKAFLPISFIYSTNNTMLMNKTTTYGLTAFERILIAVICVIFVVGIASLVGQVIPGLVIGLFVYGYFVFIGFIPIWSILVSMFIGFMVIQWRSN